MTDYKGKVAVISGAASGIGEGLAFRCASLGMKLALGDINKAALEKLAEKLKAQGAEFFICVFDVSRDEEYQAFAQKTISTYNAVDYFFNNAGVTLPGEVWSQPAKEWEWIINVNVLGAVYGIRAFIPFMIKQDKECYMVSSASVAGLLPASNSPAYVTSKHALIGLTETLSFQLQEKGYKVKLYILAPGFVQTQLDINGIELGSDQDKGDNTHDSDDFKSRYALLQKNIKEGVTVEKVVNDVFDALEKDQYYIFTNEQYYPAILKRAENIVAGKRSKPRISGATSDNKK